MIQSNTIIPTYKITAGQYVSVKVGFVSDEMLPGRVINFNPGFYADTGKAVQKAFQIAYSPSPGTYEMDKINCKNHKAFIKIVDAYNFEIEYRFFATRNLNGWIPDVAHINATALDVSSVIAGLGFYVRVGTNDCTASVPIELSPFCENPVSFQYVRPNGEKAKGYTPGEDLKIEMITNGTVSNNFYAGLIKNDATSNSVDIIPGIITNYAKVGSTVTPVYDLPSNCLQAGLGFIQQGDNSKASLTLAGSCLQSDSSYKIYVVYFQDGKWLSCISDAINQQSIKPSIVPKVTVSFTDEFGNVATKACIKGLSKLVSGDLCVTIDTADYDSQLAAAGLTGTFSDYIQSVKGFVGGSASSQTGKYLTVVDNSPTYCINGFKPSFSAAFVIFQFNMQFQGYRDIINIAFELVYDAVDTNTTVIVYDGNGPVKELCDGGDYIVSEDFSECLIFQSIEGSDYLESTIIEGLDLDESEIPVDSLVCLKAVCDSTVIVDGGPDDCECEPELPFSLRIRTCERTPLPNNDTKFELEITNFNGTIVSGQWDWFELQNANDPNSGPKYPPNSGVLSTFSGNPIDELYSSGLFEGLLNCQNIGISIVLAFEDPNGSTYNFQKNYVSLIGFCGQCDKIYEEKAILETCECPDEVDTTQCNNYASLDIECDEETQTVTINVVKNLDSAIEEEEFLCSTDGGLTFIPCPSAVIGANSVFITYDVKFSDGCENIHLEQVVECKLYAEYSNNRQLEIEDVGGILKITLEENFNSTILLDRLYVSLDAGKNFKEFDLLDGGYSPEIELEGDEDVVVYTLSQFEDGFTDLIRTKSLRTKKAIINDPDDDDPDNDGDPDGDPDTDDDPDNPLDPACLGYGPYDMTLIYDENTGSFIVNTTGDILPLEVNRLRWTLNGGNPFDENNSGVPYFEPVVGEGMFIAAWKIKLPNCPEKILHAVGFGKGCISLCADTTINVKYPDGPIQMCIVECCDDVFEIECVDHVLTVTGDLTGATIAWTGPGGFTAVGNDIEVDINGEYFATITKTGCTGSASYIFVHANAGTPTNPEIEI